MKMESSIKEKALGSLIYTHTYTHMHTLSPSLSPHPTTTILPILPPPPVGKGQSGIRSRAVKFSLQSLESEGLGSILPCYYCVNAFKIYQLPAPELSAK